MLTLESLFDHDLPELVNGYQRRADQLTLAQNISEVISTGGIGMFEAATGTGKTLSYLLPTMLDNGPFVISTGTKNLQDQIFLKDIPLLRSLFPDKKVALLKGRANYLCPHRLKKHIELKAGSDDVMHDMTTIRVWWGQTRTGDLGEIIDLEEKPQLVPLVTSTRDNCLSSRCPDYLECPLYRAREKAHEADLVIVNHHLLFADLSNKEDHLHALLPAVKAIVVDEAHQIPDIARLFFGQRLSSGQLSELSRDIRTELQLLGSDDPYTLQMTEQLEDVFVALRQLVLESTEDDFSRWLSADASNAIHAVDERLAALAERLHRVSDRSEGLSQCGRRAKAFLDQFALLSENMTGEGASEFPSEEAYVHWLERGERHFVIHLSPLSIAQDMQEIIRQSGAAWVFTSATLAVNQSFAHLENELGVHPDSAAQFTSPFDFNSAVRAWVPPGLPSPGTDEHTVALVEAVRPLIDKNPGRTFFLCTSYRAVRTAHALLKDSQRPILVQGLGSRTNLMTAFRERRGSVLLATQSFWEGVDVSGADLKLLIIDKLPFPNPSDPLFAAQSLALQQSGGNSFSELALPKTILSLKQGFGRLIRSETDMGVFVLGDSRILQRSYGSFVKKNLPAIQWQNNRNDVLRWLENL